LSAAPQQMEQTLNKIRGLHQANEEIIQRIETLDGTKKFHYFMEISPEQIITVRETVTLTPGTSATNKIFQYIFDDV
jgi:hypothetical protein